MVVTVLSFLDPPKRPGKEVKRILMIFFFSFPLAAMRIWQTSTILIKLPTTHTKALLSVSSEAPKMLEGDRRPHSLGRKEMQMGHTLPPAQTGSSFSLASLPRVVRPPAVGVTACMPSLGPYTQTSRRTSIHIRVQYAFRAFPGLDRPFSYTMNVKKTS